MKWSIVIVMMSYLVMSLWCKGFFDYVDLNLSLDFIIELWENLS